MIEKNILNFKDEKNEFFKSKNNKQKV